MSPIIYRSSQSSTKQCVFYHKQPLSPQQFSHNNVLRNFKSHVKRAGIKPTAKFTVHTLRKCCGQNWADYLPMNVVKELMGHSNISTTAEFYSTVDRDHEKKAAESVQQLLEDGLPTRENDVQVTYEGNLA